jgi:hypothetical protein
MAAPKQANAAEMPVTRGEFEALCAKVEAIEKELYLCNEIGGERRERHAMAKAIAKGQREAKFRADYLASSVPERAALLERLHSTRRSTGSEHELVAGCYGLARLLALIADMAQGLPPRAREALYALANVAPEDRRQIERGFAAPIPTVEFVLKPFEGTAMERLPLAQVSDDVAAELKAAGFEVKRSGETNCRMAIEIGWADTELRWPHDRFEVLHRTSPEFRTMVKSSRELDLDDPNSLRAGDR